MNFTIETFRDPKTFALNVKVLMASLQGNATMAREASERVYELAVELDNAYDTKLATTLFTLAEALHHQSRSLKFKEVYDLTGSKTALHDMETYMDLATNALSLIGVS